MGFKLYKFLNIMLCCAILLAVLEFNIKLGTAQKAENHIDCDYINNLNKTNNSSIEIQPAKPQLPTLTLLIRAYHASIDEILRWTFPSFQTFWPWEKMKVKWVVVLDKESDLDVKNSWKLSVAFPYPKVEYESLPLNPNIFHGKFKTKGYDRQQYSNFFCDLYTNDSVIGIVDSDAIFISAVTPKSLFERGKPVVIGAGYDNIMYPDYRAATEEVLGFRPIGHFMNNFPVLIKREVFPSLRKYIEDLHSKPFDQVFGEITQKHKQYCQFDWLINFMWRFRNSEYAWHIHFNQSGTIKDFKAEVLEINGTKSATIQSVNKPKARISTHLSKQAIRDKADDYIFEGVCHSSNYSFDKCSKYKEKLHIDLMRFEMEPVWHPVKRALSKHYEQVAEYKHRLLKKT